MEEAHSRWYLIAEAVLLDAATVRLMLGIGHRRNVVLETRSADRTGGLNQEGLSSLEY